MLKNHHFDLLRHGETEWGHTLRGSTDDALTAQGLQQMQQTIQQYLVQQDLQWDAIVSSPLQRCQVFAEALADDLKRPFVLYPEFQEMHFGLWEKQSTQEIYAHSPELLARFWQVPTQYTPPDAESLQDFLTRVQLGLTRLNQMMLSNNWQSVCIVSHGGVIKLLKCLANKRNLDEILTMTAELGKLTQFVWNECDGIMLLEG